MVEPHQQSVPHYLAREAMLAAVLSAIFAVCLLLTDTLGLSSLIGQSNQVGTTIIVLMGGVTTLTPVLWAISIECLRSPQAERPVRYAPQKPGPGGPDDWHRARQRAVHEPDDEAKEEGQVEEGRLADGTGRAGVGFGSQLHTFGRGTPMTRRSDKPTIDPKIDPKMPQRGATRSEERKTADRPQRDARRITTEPARDELRAPESARREKSGL